jgi:ribonuclease P protein component
VKFTFKKSERLNSKKVIEQLFDKKGRETNPSVFLYPFRVTYIHEAISHESKVESESEVEQLTTHDLPLTTTPTQILISVSKRSFKHAVDRNLVKRRTREAYRLNKHLLMQKPTNQIPAYIAFVYIAKTIEDYAKIEKSMKAIFKKMV